MRVEDTFGTGETGRSGLLVGLLVLIATFTVLDVILDRPASLLSAHVVVDLIILALTLAMAAYFWLEWRRARSTLRAAHRELLVRSQDRDRWRARTESLQRSLGEATDELFANWGLSPTERDTAILILKGHSHKKIAGLTGRRERTVRQHAVSVYRKSGLGGRAELSAFFLEHLTLPDAPTGDAD